MLREQPNASLKLLQAIVEEVTRIEVDVSASQAERVSYALRNFLNYAGDASLERITALVEKYQRKRLLEAARTTVEKEIGFLLRMLRHNFHSQAIPCGGDWGGSDCNRNGRLDGVDICNGLKVEWRTGASEWRRFR